VTLIRPFRALRPAAGRAAEVLAPPYDVLSSEEARVRAAGKPNSFLHISKPEIDLPEDIDPYDARVYAKAAENMHRMVADGVLVQDAVACYYAYRLTWRGRPMTGIVAGASVADYDTNRIRKHEFTRPKKEDDRVRQIEAVNAQTGPVMLVYPTAPEVDAIIAEAAAGAPDMDVTADDGVRHQLWVISDRAVIDGLTRRFDTMPALYIADGHHRSAAASRICAARGGAHDAPERAFLSVIFPDHEMRILDYNRIIRDTHGLTADALLAAIGAGFSVEPAGESVSPSQPGEFGMYLAGKWYRLRIRPELVPADPVKSLDVSLLADNLIAPVLGISDPRNDERIDFVGGIRGVQELAERVDSGEFALAFSMYPTSMAALMAVAEAGEVMPPKSTWFEPKLADGVASLVFDPK
jgi:uncharacterized protein (DUF1015 family)